MAPSRVNIVETPDHSPYGKRLEPIKDALDAMEEPGIPKFTSFQEERQWRLEHMAAAFRYFNRMGWTEGDSGHISVRDPEYTGALWINTGYRHFGLMKASDMVLVDIETGRTVGGCRKWPPHPGFHIHTAIMKRRPEVNAVCHAHTTYGRAYSAFGKPLEMLVQDSCQFYNSHTVYDAFGGIGFGSNGHSEAERTVDALGDFPNKACILRNHGFLTVNETVDGAAYLFSLFDRCCQIQLIADAAAAGDVDGSRPKKVIDDEEAKYTWEIDGTPEVQYWEFQNAYEYEEAMCSGDFKAPVTI